jgi:type IV pilus biogenesis protein CpaD/CtpE
VVLLLLSGCKLIDQTTFNPQAGKLVTPPVIVSPSAPPLLVIPVGQSDAGYGAIIRQQVDAALAVKPDAQFEVVTVVPGVGATASQTAAATEVIADARQVARVINDEGVDDGRISLSAKSEAGLAARELRVFVR